MGDTRRPLIVMLLVNGTNIAASWLLMSGIPALGIPALGVIGSACGDAAGWTMGAALALFFLSRQHPASPKLTLGAFKLDRAVMGRMLRIGLPLAAELFVLQMGVVAFSCFVAGLLLPLHCEHPEKRMLRRLGQHKAARRLLRMEPDSPSQDLPLLLINH